jgi:actin-related protein
LGEAEYQRDFARKAWLECCEQKATAEARATEAERRVEAMREALEKCQKHFKPLSKDRPPITPDDPEWSAMVRAYCEEFAREYEELDKAIDAALAQPQEQSDAS